MCIFLHSPLRTWWLYTLTEWCANTLLSSKSVHSLKNHWWEILLQIIRQLFWRWMYIYIKKMHILANAIQYTTQVVIKLLIIPCLCFSRGKVERSLKRTFVAAVSSSPPIKELQEPIPAGCFSQNYCQASSSKIWSLTDKVEVLVRVTRWSST